MKKAIIILVILLGVFGQRVFAGDPECLMMYGNQEVLVLGEIVEINNEIVTLEVSHKLQGECNDTIKIRSFDKFWITSYEPNVGDYCLISLDTKNSIYIIKQGVYKTDTDDYSTLKTIKRSDGKFEDVLTTIDWFVNSNGKYKEFYFESSKVYLKKENGEEIQVYPDINEDKENVGINTKNTKESKSSNEGSEMTDRTQKVESKKIQKNNLGISMGVIVFLGTVLIILKKYNKKL
ncbi:hypothetical protein [Oceanirhabdus sp. W0125-5]|uniref:hypothetical protein n=1 Tax=Oceanirhabdus sp. W0125-5 TaxID=2999116 RepID=UPI0022F2AB7D|nr:hypothetical protein [Oceanirhabdus sp. W0125-5]WBW99668.1 hypothetical protein OW730_13235 [Oceanirhabdus sp. W0125-5]